MTYSYEHVVGIRYDQRVTNRIEVSFLAHNDEERKISISCFQTGIFRVSSPFTSFSHFLPKLSLSLSPNPHFLSLSPSCSPLNTHTTSLTRTFAHKSRNANPCVSRVSSLSQSPSLFPQSVTCFAFNIPFNFCISLQSTSTVLSILNFCISLQFTSTVLSILNL